MLRKLVLRKLGQIKSERQGRGVTPRGWPRRRSLNEKGRPEGADPTEVERTQVRAPREQKWAAQVRVLRELFQ